MFQICNSDDRKSLFLHYFQFSKQAKQLTMANHETG